MISPQDKRILCAKELRDVMQPTCFGLVSSLEGENPYWSIRPVSVGGRNAAWFVEHEAFSGVLRQYRRGGFIGKLLKQSYCWMNADKTRAWAEFRVMDYLYQKDFPVPKPLGAMYLRQGFWYKAALITETIPQAQTLVEAIAQSSQQNYPKLAATVAKIIERMHDLKVNHADLNAFNILLDAKREVYVIDFDKARIELSQGQWCQDNINRLERHLQKVLGEQGLQFMVYIRQNLAKT